MHKDNDIDKALREAAEDGDAQECSALLAQQNFLYALEIERIKALGLEQRLLNRVKELEKKLLNRKAAGPASQPACPSLRRKFF